MHYDKTLPRRPVKSTAVRSIGYDEGEWVLQVEFTSGSTYNYFRVPPREHQALLKAPSVGDYLNRQVKRYYEYEEAGAVETAA